MCAIAGMFDLPFTPETSKQMLSTMQRRGPDEIGVCCFPNGCLLHGRLSVIDLTGGKQPMELTRSGETYTMVYNGELYNTSAIRDELTMLGHTFLGHSDTEVVLHAFAQWEEQALDKLNGIFAFAVWERNKRRLFLGRDRMGVKPLFYMLHKNGILFASEIKTILAYPSVDAELDAEGVAQLILLGPGRTPGSGVLRGIRELEPGCLGWYEEGKWSWKRYWKLTDREHTDSFEDTVQNVRYLVMDSIRRQMVSDVPIGTFLSGGLDSSLISAICANEMQKRGQRLHTFSVDYENNEKYFIPGKFQPNSDNYYIEVMHSKINTIHHRIVLDPQMLIDALEASTEARDLPGMADVDFSLLLFCKEIRQHIKVGLSGECADEIFGGYPWFTDPEIRTTEGFPWAQNTKFRTTFLHPEHINLIGAEEFVMDRYRQTVIEADILPGTSPEERRMKEMVNLNQRWFMQTLLDRKDRMSMYSGLEVRVPFCDYRIAEYLYSVPWEYKYYLKREKGLLRRAMLGVLPEEVLYRKKSPYPKTHDPHYMQLVSQMLRNLLDQNDAPIYKIIRKEALTQLLTDERAWPWYGQLMKTPQTIAYMLQINYWLQKYRVSIV